MNNSDFAPAYANTSELSLTPLAGLITPSGYRFFDNSTLNDFRVCMRRGYFKSIRHFDTDYEKAALIFGSSWHAAMDVMWQMCADDPTAKADVVITASHRAFLKYWNSTGMVEKEDFDLYPRTPGRAAEMLVEYYTRYESLLKGRDLVAVEQSFIIPLTDDEQRLMYIGKLDKVWRRKESANVSISDHKTASSMSSTWLESFSPNSQFDGYFHAGKMLYGDDFDTIYIDGALVQKTKIDFMQLPLMRQVTQIEAWLWETLDLISLIESYEQTLLEVRAEMQKGKKFNFLPTFPKCTTSCTNYFGKCPFLDLCKFQGNPEEHQVQDGFQISQWKPFEISERPDGTFQVGILPGGE